MIRSATGGARGGSGSAPARTWPRGASARRRSCPSATALRRPGATSAACSRWTAYRGRADGRYAFGPAEASARGPPRRRHDRGRDRRPLAAHDLETSRGSVLFGLADRLVLQGRQRLLSRSRRRRSCGGATARSNPARGPSRPRTRSRLSRPPSRRLCRRPCATRPAGHDGDGLRPHGGGLPIDRLRAAGEARVRHGPTRSRRPSAFRRAGQALRAEPPVGRRRGRRARECTSASAALPFSRSPPQEPAGEEQVLVLVARDDGALLHLESGPPSNQTVLFWEPMASGGRSAHLQVALAEERRLIMAPNVCGAPAARSRSRIPRASPRPRRGPSAATPSARCPRTLF